MTKIEQLREETYLEAKDLLQTYGKSVIIRPTGFGKTGILTRFIREYKHVIYLYPTDIIRQTVLDFYYDHNVPKNEQIENVTFMTYHKLVRLSEGSINDYKQTDLIIADECHRLGAKETVRAMTSLLEHLPKAHLLGATATPERMDLVDEIDLFFQNHVVSPYTLHDAFSDGILKRPYYCFCSYGLSDLSEVESQTKLQIEQMDSERENAEKLLRSRLIEISDISRMDHIIKNTCDEYAKDTNYMKFIVFFSSFKHMHDKCNDVVSWFQDAYPDHEIRTLIISSEKLEYAENVNRLPDYDCQDNTIDLLLCCDMLNMGYHISSLTGIVMYRGTTSGIIFAQQLGRVLNSGHDAPGIVFDVVDNIHREAMYDVLGEQSQFTLERKARYETLSQKQNAANLVLTKAEQKELNQLKQSLEQTHRWWTHANDLEPMDLIATGYEATYRELIAKTVAEPVSMRCRQAWARWIEKGGDPSVMTTSAILGQQPPTQTPLSPFCKLKTVSVQAVLDEMGVTNE